MRRMWIVCLALSAPLAVAERAPLAPETQGGVAAEESTPPPVMESDAPTSTGPEAQPAPGASEAAARGEVSRSGFTSGIADREPVDRILSLGTQERKIYYFTELHDLAGETVYHRWQYQGQVMAEVPFQVGGSRWRVWSSKNLIPAWTGQWRVQVVTEGGRVLSEERFEYEPAGEGR